MLEADTLIVDRPDFVLTGGPVIHYWLIYYDELVAVSQNRPEL